MRWGAPCLLQCTMFSCSSILLWCLDIAPGFWSIGIPWFLVHCHDNMLSQFSVVVVLNQVQDMGCNPWYCKTLTKVCNFPVVVHLMFTVYIVGFIETCLKRVKDHNYSLKTVCMNVLWMQIVLCTEQYSSKYRTLWISDLDFTLITHTHTNKSLFQQLRCSHYCSG